MAPDDNYEDIINDAMFRLGEIWAQEANRIRDEMLKAGQYREYSYREGHSDQHLPKSLVEDGVEKVQFSTISERSADGVHRVRAFYIGKNEYPQYWELRREFERTMETVKLMKLQSESTTSGPALK
ncbi:MAG: hypothetical protein JNJ88_00865 [Planctomycetes bacterium]|nr:hypothetical protein [Planctomycetota bacterium]